MNSQNTSFMKNRKGPSSEPSEGGGTVSQQEPSQQASLMAPSNILKEAWGVFKNNFLLFVGIAIIPVLIVLLIAQGLKFLPENNLPLALGAGIILFFVMLVISTWSQLALFYAAKERGRLSLKQAFSEAWGNILSFLWISMLSSFIVAGGGVLFIIPGFLFAVWFSFSLIIFVSEGTKGFDALFRSKKYVEGLFGSIVWRGVFLALIFILISIPVVIVAVFLPEQIGKIVQRLFSGLILAPLGILYSFVLFEKVRNIKGSISYSPSGGEKAGYFAVGFLGFVLIPVILFSALLRPLFGARNRAAELQKINNLRMLQTSLELHYSEHRSYPPSLDELSGEGALFEVDEETKSYIDYSAIEGGESYEACVNLKDMENQCITPEDSSVDLPSDSYY